eukprot:7263977-Lingulodinium_polyedra.AAC.1
MCRMFARGTGVRAITCHRALFATSPCDAGVLFSDAVFVGSRWPADAISNLTGSLRQEGFPRGPRGPKRGVPRGCRGFPGVSRVERVPGTFKNPGLSAPTPRQKSGR